MNKFIFIMMSAFIVGCGASVQQPRAATVSEVKCEPQFIVVPPPKEDSFDAGGKVVASGSRFVWNAGKGVWEWATSEEVTRRVKDGAVVTWDFTKRGVVRVWDSMKVLVNGK